MVRSVALSMLLVASSRKAAMLSAICALTLVSPGLSPYSARNRASRSKRAFSQSRRTVRSFKPRAAAISTSV